MPLAKRKDEHSPCPKTKKPSSHCKSRHWPQYIFPVTGLLALIWFLVRVIPKPSRATYPCQRVAFPLASGFIIWLMGLIGSVAAFRRAKKYLTKARYALAAVCIVISVAFIWVAMNSTGQKIIYGHEPLIANDPLGEAKGVYPGRVAWIHDPDATDWAGPDSGERWYSNSCTNQQVVNEMLSKALRALSGRSTDYHAWDAIFRNFNQQMGKGNIGYIPGEKIAIKVNFTLTDHVSSSTMEKPPGYIDRIDNSPQLAIALLRQLTEVVGANPCDISIGDPSRIMPNYWYGMVEQDCPGVLYLTNSGFVGSGRTIVSRDYSAPFYWSDPCAAHWTGVTEQDYIPLHFAQAEYFIDFPILKTHGSSGITVCGKNHYGSLIRSPADAGYYSMHWSRVYETPGMGHYRAIVDLMGHPRLGGKTLLALIDGLYAGIDWSSWPVEWWMSPFNYDWPSSIIVSQDQIAADSVAFDFLYTEWYFHAGMSGADDYLHEAALANDPCSGTFYDPNHDGVALQSLGVHEHWNNEIDKEYSRNLDPVNGKGIELVTSQVLNLLTAASRPIPANRAMGVQNDPTLMWMPGRYADKHDVYFGTDEAKVTDANRTNPLDVLVGKNHDTNSITVTGLVPSTTYYWRIDEVNEAGPDPCLWEGDVWSFASAPLTAHNPDPYDGERWVDVDANLSWGAGWGAVSHDVYFGTAPDPPLVEPGWSTTTYDPGTMDDDKTYYWRIDEYDGSTTHPGDLWSFTTLDAAAGIKAEYYNGTPYLSGTPVLKGTDYSIDFDWGYGRPDPNVGDESSDEWSVRWVAEVNVPDTNTYTFTTVRELDDGVRLWVDGKLIIKNWPGDNDILEDTGTIDLVAGLVPIVVEFLDGWGPATAQLSWESLSLPKEVIPRDAFFLPRRSVSPDPLNGATDVRSDPILSWVSGRFAITRDVYFGTDEDRVADANRDNTLDVLVSYNESKDVNYYEPNLLKLNTTYYWRVNDINGSDIWPSSVWSFTTGSYHVVDDMEDYTDRNTIIPVWHDGTGGSYITTSTDDYMAGIVHGGAEAMAYSYDNNSVPYYSEAYADTNGTNSLEFGTNWRLQDVKALSLWFLGQGNPDISGSFTKDANGTYTLTSDGRGIKGKADSFYFVYGQVDGTVASIYARVLNVENTDPYAKAGVMIRDTLDQDARYGAVVVTPENVVIFQYRMNVGSSASSTTVSGITAPCWVKVESVKLGPQYFIKGYYATTEGVPTSWTSISQPQVTLTTPIHPGLCATSSSYGEMCEAKISNVTTTPSTSLTNSQDIGRVYNDPEEMYVVLEDSSDSNGIVYHPDLNVTQIGEWKEWRIDLNDFIVQGVNVCDVNRIYIGFGDRAAPGGLGIVYIDDIQLYLAEFYEPECPPLPADLVRDGVIDHGDLAVLIDYWLQTPPDPNINLYDSGTIDFKDVAEMGKVWGQKQVWPTW